MTVTRSDGDDLIYAHQSIGEIIFSAANSKRYNSTDVNRLSIKSLAIPTWIEMKKKNLKLTENRLKILQIFK